ncbi:MAG: hypothetical protein KKA61_00925 [Nanoarchaeota archaeon]|nr:hypothetical protein [Nanoarchaeota archaeon]
MLGFSTIIKLVMGLIVIFVVFGIVNTLFPDALKSFSETTHIEFPTFGLGKEKQQSNLEITENMKKNVEIIKNKISELSAEDYEPSNRIVELSIGPITFDLTDKMEKKMEETEFEKFEGNMLAIIKKDNKTSDIAYIAVTDQIDPNYETIQYTPCFVTVIETGMWWWKKSGFSEKSFVDKILFVDKDHFKVKVNGETTKYKLKGLTKIEDDVCFVGE